MSLKDQWFKEHTATSKSLSSETSWASWSRVSVSSGGKDDVDSCSSSARVRPKSWLTWASRATVKRSLAKTRLTLASDSFSARPTSLYVNPWALSSRLMVATSWMISADMVSLFDTYGGIISHPSDKVA